MFILLGILVVLRSDFKKEQTEGESLSTCVGPQISPLQMRCTLENTVHNAFQKTYGLQVPSGSGSILKEEKTNG